jgi:hypothetical protein
VDCLQQPFLTPHWFDCHLLIGASAATQMRALIESMAVLHAKFWNKNKRVERVAADATPLGMCAR